MFLPFIVFLLPFIHADSNVEILPKDCDCRDWYGGCRLKGDKWVDDGVWNYDCQGNNGSDATFNGCFVNEQQNISPNENVSIDGLQHSCSHNSFRIKYEIESHCSTSNRSLVRIGEHFRDGIFDWICLETGKWVKGCYYQKETNEWNLLPIGGRGIEGLVIHACEKVGDNPGKIQYFTQIRNDVEVASPENKGINQLLPEAFDGRIKEETPRWLHSSVSQFITRKENSNRIRYLPASRNKSL